MVVVVIVVIAVADAVAVPVEKGEDVIVSEGKAVDGCEERECGWDDEDATTASAASPFPFF